MPIAYGPLLFNAFQKKFQKTPKQEIELAKKLKKEYFNLKNKKKGKRIKLLKMQKLLTNF
jgi:hypothetical protein